MILTNLNIWEVLTAVGTILMAIGTFVTIYKLYESKQAKLFATITIHTSISSKGNPKKYWCLEISNIGPSPAYDIEMKLNPSFISNLPIVSERKILNDLTHRRFTINPGMSKIYPLCPISVSEDESSKNYKAGEYKKIVDTWLAENYSKPFLVELLYNGKCVWYRKTLKLENYDTRSAIFNEDEKIIKVDIINGKTTDEKP